MILAEWWYYLVGWVGFVVWGFVAACLVLMLAIGDGGE